MKSFPLPTATAFKLPLLLTLLAAVLGVSACGETGASKGTGGGMGNTTHTSARSAGGETEGEGQTQKLAVEAQQVLRRLSSAAGEMAHKASAERAFARRLLGYLQTRSASLAQRAMSQLPASNPAREAIVAAGEQGAKTAAELQRSASSAQAGNVLRSVQGELGAVASEVGALSQRLADGEAKKIAGDLEAVGKQLSAAH